MMHLVLSGGVSFAYNRRKSAVTVTFFNPFERFKSVLESGGFRYFRFVHVGRDKNFLPGGFLIRADGTAANFLRSVGDGLGAGFSYPPLRLPKHVQTSGCGS